MTGVWHEPGSTGRSTPDGQVALFSPSFDVSMVMTPERWSRIRDIFVQTHELPPAERAAVIDETCGKDADLRREVESLLVSHDSAGRLFEPIPEHLFATASPDAEAEKRVGTLVGHYRIVRKIAEGGMGEVYEAERDDGTFTRRVAIKLIRSNISRKDSVRRFEAERHVLAALHHLNIAQLIDAGTTDDGVPFLMMEYVDGKRIDDYCDDQKLSLEQRLRMFRTVCSAVQFAHQNLVVHRDIKPGNILVTADGAPKLLDFGIAALVSDEGDAPARTRTGPGFMTPEYASPEQARGDTVTTLSDVYSLGVLLYKLLTGRKPYDVSGTLPFETLKTIIETDPAKPSAEDPAILIPERDIPRARRTLRGDIDAIVLRALRKEPQLRYQSVQEFSDDIRRFQEGLPVVASRNSSTYRLRKFIRRNRGLAVAITAVIVSLIVGLAATLYQVRIARQEKAKAESINTFLQSMLSYANPAMNLLPEKEGATTIKDVLDDASYRLQRGTLSDQPEVRAALHSTIAACYQVQGRYDLAARHIEDEVAILTRLYGEESEQVRVALRDLGQSFIAFGDYARAESLIIRMLPGTRADVQRGIIPVQDLAVSMNDLAAIYRWTGRPKAAEQLLRDGLTLGPFSKEQGQYVLGIMRGNLAAAVADQGRLEESVSILHETIAMYPSRFEPPDLGFNLTLLGSYLTLGVRSVEGDSALKRAERIYRRVLSPTHLRIGDNLTAQAVSYYQRGMFPEAEELINDALHIYDASAKEGHYNYPTALGIRAVISNRTGRLQEAERVAREAVRLRERSLPKGNWMTAMARSELGECLTTQHRFVEAESLLTQSCEDLVVSQGATHPRTVLVRNRLLRLYEEWKKPQ